MSLRSCNNGLGQKLNVDAELDLHSWVKGSEPSHAGQITPIRIGGCLSLEQQRVQEGQLEGQMDGQKERRCREDNRDSGRDKRGGWEDKGC